MVGRAVKILAFGGLCGSRGSDGDAVVNSSIAGCYYLSHSTYQSRLWIGGLLTVIFYSYFTFQISTERAD